MCIWNMCCRDEDTENNLLPSNIIKVATWVLSRRKAPAIRLFVQQIVQDNNHEYLYICIIGPLRWPGGQ